MASLKEEAKAYEPQHTLNIAELEKVPTDIDLKKKVAKEGTPDEFRYKYVEVDGKQYRVPGVVIGDLKALLEKIPTLTHFTVTKQGSGIGTRYQVIPLMKPGEQVIQS